MPNYILFDMILKIVVELRSDKGGIKLRYNFTTYDVYILQY